MDERVLQTQIWLNSTYGNNESYEKVTEDGVTGGKTVTALIRALQIELEIEVDGVFGEGTENAFVALSTSSDSSNLKVKHQIYILQGGCYCKGYDPNGFDGVFSGGTSNAVVKLKGDAGLTSPSAVADAMFMKALLTTDGYVLASKGDAKIREIQQALNRNYSEYIGLIPCDGIFVKATLRGMISGLQVEQKKEYSNNVIDGIWGTTTMNRCPTLQRYGTVTNKQYVYLLQYALYANGYDPNGFDGGFGGGVQTAVKNFQSFVGLTADGIVGKQTWASLLVSYGDKTRVGTACDCMHPLTIETAQTLVENGRTVVGRYLTGGSNKKLTLSELQIIYDAGLNIFPIYQTTNNYLNYFTATRGARDAYLAYDALTNLKFPSGTTVYVAVDFDATETNVENAILPYFKEFASKFNSFGNGKYKIGIYGPRYVCTLIKEAGISSSSFVCDMSSGFSGNIGKKLPTDWAFDQISTISLGTNESLIEIDNNIASGKNTGIHLDPSSIIDITDSDKTIEKIAKVSKLCSRYGIPVNFPAINFDFGIEYLVVTGSLCDIYMSSDLEFTTNPDATISLNVSNGEIEDTTFSTAIGSLMAETDISNVSNGFPDFSSLAVEIGEGKIEIKITPNMALNIIEISVKSIVYQSSSANLNSDVAVTVRYVYKTNGAKPETVTAEVYDKINEWVSSIDWVQLGKNTIYVAISAIAVYSLVTGIGEIIAAGSLTIDAVISAITAILSWFANAIAR